MIGRLRIALGATPDRHLPHSRSNRSDPALVHHIHACPRGEEVCIGGLANVSSEKEAREIVALKECWLPENLTSDACKGDEILW